MDRADGLPAFEQGDTDELVHVAARVVMMSCLAAALDALFTTDTWSETDRDRSEP